MHDKGNELTVDDRNPWILGSFSPAIGNVWVLRLVSGDSSEAAR